jgi:outer membrane receptor protein involved in Fe transport
LTSDGINRSASTLLLNMGLAYQLNKHWRISADLLNLTNRRNDDITYAYISRITPTAAPAFTNVFHPAEPFQVRFGLQYRFKFN